MSEMKMSGARALIWVAAIAVATSGVAQAAAPAGGPSGGPPGAGGPPGMMRVPEIDRSKDCDSACLRAHMDKYLAAYAKHDPSTLEVAPTLRAAENSHAAALGDNSWNTVQKLRPGRATFTDPFAGQVLTIGVLEMRAAEPFIYSIRLKIVQGRISESEIMLTSDKHAGQHFRPDLMAQVAPALDAALPQAQRLSRTDLLGAARTTWGLASGSRLPNSSSCQHTENFEAPFGNSPCRGGTGRSSRNLRIPLVDVEKGVVVNYQLQDAEDPQPRDPPPGEAEAKTAVFYYRPLTFYVMQLAKLSSADYQADAMFMNLQELGAPIVFRR